MTETRYSTDDGASFATKRTVGTLGSGSAAGADVIAIGDVILAGGSGKVRTATSGGAYSDETNSPTTYTPTLIAVPFFQIGSTSTKNISVAAPHYLAGSALQASGESFWKVAGAAGVDITPSATAVIFSPQGGACSQWSGSVFAVLAQEGVNVKLFTTTNAGSSWTDCGTVNVGTTHLRMRKGDNTAAQLFLAGGVIYYSADRGATITQRDSPTTGRVVRGIEVWG